MSGIPLLITAGISGASESSLSLSDVTTGNTSTGTVLYDRITFSDSLALAQNKKIQNTLTLLTYTTTPSIVA